jgi:hypothetical protein
MNQIIYSFWHLLVEAAPWFFGGALLGAAMQAFLKPRWVMPWVGSPRASVLNAAVAGAVLPGCSMITIPLAASLKTQGARLGTLTALVMISPILSPETLALTATMLGTGMTVGRIILPLIATLVIGLSLNSLEAHKIGAFQMPSASAVNEPCGCCSTDPTRKSFWRCLLELLHPLWIYFILGLLAVALIKAFVPEQTVDQYMHGGLGAYVAAALAGIPLYVCEGAEVPLTFGLLKMGVGPGPAFTFMLGAVGTCIPTIAMAPRIIGIPATYLYVAAWLVLAIGAGMVMGSFLS